MRKLVAALLAVLIYGAVRFQLQEEETFSNVQVAFITENGSMEVLDSLEGKKLFTNVTVQGTKRSLSKIKTNPVIEHVIAAATPPGLYAFRLRPSDVKLPPDVRIAPNGIQPADFKIELNPKIQQDVDIRLRLNREGLPADMAIRKVTVHPRKASVFGPEKYVRDVTEVVTKEITFASDQEPLLSYELDVELVQIPHVTVKPAVVRVSLELTRSKDSRLYPQVPLTVLSPPGSELQVVEFPDRPDGKPTADLTVEGPAASLDFLSAHSIRAFVEPSEEDGPGIYNLPVRVWIYAKDCTWQKCTPGSLKVRVARRPPGPEAPAAPKPPPGPGP